MFKTEVKRASDEAYWAALDLGSNSFHLLLVRRERESFVIVERLKEKVQLLAGFSDGYISKAAYARGTACLERFAQRLSCVPVEQIRSMGTYALRQSTDTHDFALLHSAAVGVPVDIISGNREAELIYQAVDYYEGVLGVERLALDIGGGSTEFAFGDGPKARSLLSIDVGCVALKDKIIGDQGLTPGGYLAAKTAALRALDQQLSLHPEIDKFRGLVFGTSGTIESIQTVLRANGWSWDTITAEGIRNLEDAITEERWVVDAGVPGLAPDRTDIFPTGLAILSACFERLEISELKYVDVSLLHGIICEALMEEGMQERTNLKAQSVAMLAQRFGTDVDQARRVQSCVHRLYLGTSSWWDALDPLQSMLEWAAQLHEIGMHISARHYHRHGGYVIKHAELPGLSDQEQSILALLIRGHRRSLPGLSFRAFDPTLAEKLLRLLALLRIAVILERSHNDADSPKFEVEVVQDGIELQFTDQWLATHPLSRRELEVEAEQLGSAGLVLSVKAD